MTIDGLQIPPLPPFHPLKIPAPSRSICPGWCPHPPNTPAASTLDPPFGRTPNIQKSAFFPHFRSFSAKIINASAARRAHGFPHERAHAFTKTTSIITKYG
jgi:hypothetical protein